VGSVVPMADHVMLLGVILDNQLSMDKQGERSQSHVLLPQVYVQSYPIMSCIATFGQPSLSAMPT